MLSGSFVSRTVFNLSRNLITDTAIKVLGESLNFVPMHKKNLNESEMQKDFMDFYRLLRPTWYFRLEPTPLFSKKPSISHKSS